MITCNRCYLKPTCKDARAPHLLGCARGSAQPSQAGELWARDLAKAFCRKTSPIGCRNCLHALVGACADMQLYRPRLAHHHGFATDTCATRTPPQATDA